MFSEEEALQLFEDGRESTKEEARQFLNNRGISVAAAGNLARCLDIKEVEEAIFGYLKFSVEIFRRAAFPDGKPLPHEEYIQKYSLVKAYEYMQGDINQICEMYRVAETGVSDDEAD